MDVNERECMFCHGELETAEQPENLAFMDHLEDSAPCSESFAAWTDNMQSDYLGG